MKIYHVSEEESRLEAEEFYILLDQSTQLPVVEYMEDPETKETQACLTLFVDPKIVPKIDNNRYGDTTRFAVGVLLGSKLNDFLAKVKENGHVALLALEEDGEVSLKRLTKMFTAIRV